MQVSDLIYFLKQYPGDIDIMVSGYECNLQPLEAKNCRLTEVVKVDWEVYYGGQYSEDLSDSHIGDPIKVIYLSR